MTKRLGKPSEGSLFLAGAHTTGRRVSERATDGLEAFRLNRLRGEADIDSPDKWVRFSVSASCGCPVPEQG